MDSVDKIVMNATCSATAIRGIYSHYKSQNRNYSLALLCKKAGIPSKGYLSDVMRGARKLNLKYLEGMVDALHLNLKAASLFRLLVQIDHQADSTKLAELNERRRRVTKSLKIIRGSVPRPLTSIFFNLEVFCRIGLFANNAKRSDLIKFYGRTRSEEVDRAIQELKDAQLIAVKGEALSICSNEFVFETSQNNSHFLFLQECLNHTMRSIERWFTKSDMAYIESSIISVQTEKYKKALPKLRSLMAELQSDLESENADRLILYNIQVMPLD